MPSSVKRGLRIAWFALLGGVVANLLALAWFAFPGAPFTLRSMAALLLASAVLLLPPGFLGYWLTLVALIFIRRGAGRLRWLLAAVIVWRGISFVLTYPGHSLA